MNLHVYVPRSSAGEEKLPSGDWEIKVLVEAERGVWEAVGAQVSEEQVIECVGVQRVSRELIIN